MVRTVILIKWKCLYCSYFKQELERETDPFRRNLLLQEIRRVEQRILELMREERMRIEQENRNMETALAMLKEREKQNKKK